MPLKSLRFQQPPMAFWCDLKFEPGSRQERIYFTFLSLIRITLFFNQNPFRRQKKDVMFRNSPFGHSKVCPIIGSGCSGGTTAWKQSSQAYSFSSPIHRGLILPITDTFCALGNKTSFCSCLLRNPLQICHFFPLFPKPHFKICISLCN